MKINSKRKKKQKRNSILCMREAWPKWAKLSFDFDLVNKVRVEKQMKNV